MKWTRALRGVIAILPLVAGCQNNLPPVETAPNTPGPRMSDIVDHIRCELATVVNSPDEFYATGRHIDRPVDPLAISPEKTLLSVSSGTAKDVQQRIIEGAKNPTGPLAESDTRREDAESNNRIFDLLTYIKKYHMVASVSLTLDALDSEGLNPSLNFMAPSIGGVASTKPTWTIGPQLSGTQEKTLTVSFPVDMAQLYGNDVGDKGLITMVQNDYKVKYCLQPTDNIDPNKVTNTGVSGNLGLADIIVDGMIGLDHSGESNLYSSAGITSPVIARHIDYKITKSIAAKDGITADPATGISISSSDGELVIQPPSAGTLAAKTASFTGLVTLSVGKVDTPYNAILNGTVMPTPPRDKKAEATAREKDKAACDSSPASDDDSQNNDLNFTLSGTLSKVDPPPAGTIRISS